jgi:hypothetical protein
MSEKSPSPEDLQRELERVRAASPPLGASPQQPPIRKLLFKGLLRLLLLWGALILMFLAIWQFLGPSK